MKNRKNILKSALYASIFFMSMMGSPSVTAFADISDEKLENWPKWMQAIPDDTPLAQISIPGTHDSGTFRLQDPVKQVWGMTQEHDFRYQMNHGARIFDIRGRLTDDNTIVLHHGPIYLYVTLQQFINEAKNFLEENPSETIIMSLKKEYDDMDGAEDTFVNTFETKYFDDPIFLKTEGNIKLGDARGKLVLVRRYVGSKMTGGYQNFYWPDNKQFNSAITYNLNVTVQDKYNVGYDEKIESIKSMIDQANENSQNINRIYMNFISLSSGGTAWSSPYYYASYLNPEVAQYIKQKDPKRVGWIIQDYLGDKWSPALYQEIIKTNKSL
ncbi:phosphatidylinositol-specific phospholipase C domain-containing protein [Bacillus cytotoxicus]|nr:phosphatidylinositol-specific phospholipase C domain-containing protein [Bacillus cereus group sp. BfR-BA-01492]EMA6342901.1 phosphatidylinositol-specific phospholipase C domain-containing protein [Bacillus cytotoxicus]